MAAAAVDVGYLAASYSVPETSLQSLLSEPTVELVQSLLTQIEAKAREYDELKSEKLRSEVELEAAVHSADSRARTLKATADKASKEAEELRLKLAQEENARQQIETELHSLQTAATSSTSEVQTLESRIKTLEAQNRDTLALHEAKSAAHDRLAEELSAQHQKFVELRKMVAELEEKNQTLENAATSVKFRESNLQQEIELLKKNNEWFESELNTRAADNTRFRKEKNAQVAELQRSNAEASHTIDSLRRTETSQRQRLEELEQTVEQSLARIQQLQEDAAQHEQAFRTELDSARRLATLHQESANTVKARLQEVQAQLTQTGDNAALEVGQLQAEVESERNKASQYENRVTELESVVENLESQISELRTSAHVPATPRRGINGSFDTPGRAGSPGVFTPGGSRTKGGLSITQLYAENTQLKADLRTYQDRDEKRSATLNEMLEELESRAPEIAELRQENERLTSEAGDISALLEEAMAEKEAARKEARKAQGDYKGLLRENELQRQQLRDVGQQITLLVYRQRAQEEGLDALTPEQQQYLLDTADNKLPENELQDSTATGRLISQHLLLFKDINDLQAQNTELLRTVREVAETYEGQEAQQKADQQKKDREKLEKLEEKVAQYEDEIRSINLRSQSLIKERDMYRRIVTSRGQLPLGSDAESAFDQSMAGRGTVTPPPGKAAPSVEQTPHTGEIAGYEKLIKELQAHLDLLKEESATDRASLKQQVDRLTKENSQLQSERIKLAGANDNAQQRFDWQQKMVNNLQADKTELQKQLDSVQKLFSQQDIRTQQAAEELVEAKGRIDSLERENTNLKASQTLWKTIEARLTESNKELTEQRGQLSKMVTDLQNLRNEQELAEAENRRHLQDRANSLEAELQNARRKLEEEIEDHKKATLRREYEQTETRRRIDDLVKASTDARLEAASIKSARDQLQERVNELQNDLRNAEERAHSLQPRPTPRINGSTEVDEDSHNQEELTAQISELQRKYERKQEELDAAAAQIETYKSIAQEAEEQLQSYVDAQEQLQQEINRVEEQKDATIRDLRQRVEEISSELATTNTELSELRGKHEQENLRLSQQKEILETEIVRLKDDANEYKAQAESQVQLVASQAEIATRAQQDYENELAKHGETMKNLRNLREEHNSLRTEVSQFKAQAEAARTSLAQSEEHWTSTRERYERELTEARSRYNDLNDHNKTLLQQFDGFQAQIASLKSSRMTVAAGEHDVTNFDNDQNGLQEIITYLRQEKDILEVQLSMKDQEVKRLEQQLSHTQSQLDQTREKLVAEQSQASSRQGSANLQALQESIEQLNVYRESTTTLRNELRRTEAQLAEKSKEIDELHNQIQPLQARVHEVEGELELNVGHLKTVEEDRDRWQKRHQDVLQRYDRIDPKELEDLKKQIEDLQIERDQALQQANGLDERIESAKTETREEMTAKWEERRQAMINQFKEKVKVEKQKLTDSQAANKTLTEERDGLKQQLAVVQEELEATILARDEAIAKATASADVVMDEEGQVDENSGASSQHIQELEARANTAETRVNEEANRAVALHIQLQGMQEQVQKLENQAGELQQRIASLNTELSDARSQKAQAEARVEELQSTLTSAGQLTAPQGSEDVEKLKEELTAAQKEVEDLRTRADMADSLVGTNTEDSVRSVADQVAEQVAATKASLDEREADLSTREANLSTREADLEKSTTTRLEKMKTKCNDLIKKKNQEMDQWKTEHQAELNRIRQEHESTTTPNNVSASQEDAAKEPVAPESETPVKIETVPGAGATQKEIQDFISGSPVAKGIIQRNVKTHVDAAKKAAEETTAQKIQEATESIKQEQEKIANHRVEAATAKVKEEQEKVVNEKIAEAKEKTKLETEKRFAVKESMAKNKLNKLQTESDKVKAQWAVVEKAASETPTRAVKEVWEEAKDAQPAPAPAVNTPAKPQPSGQAASAVVSSSTQSGQQQTVPGGRPGLQPTATNIPQANGAKPNPFGQQGMGGQAQANPFHQSQNPFGQVPNQTNQGFGGYSGMAQPGFSASQGATFNQSNRPNSPFGQQQQQQQQQQQPQQGGRGQQNIGTGPAALRQLVGQQGGQSGIPRGGGATGIPRPGGGRGQGNQQQQNQNQGPNANAQGAGASQIGRGGGRGGGRGRGQVQTNVPGQGQSQGSNSPRGLNPGASNFQPGGAGRGQKRGPDEISGSGDTDGSAHRGGKRARGGRGGVGGGGNE